MDETATTTGPKQAPAGDADAEPTTEATTEVARPTEDDNSPTTRLPAASVTDSPTTELPTDVASRDDLPTDVLHPTTPLSAGPSPEAGPSGAEPGATPPAALPEGGTTWDGSATATPPKPDLLSTRLRRSKDDKMISGVCGGFAKTLNIDPLWLRLGLIVAVLLGFGVGLIVYLACWILMPLED